MDSKDKQIVEIEGVNWLIVELMKAGIEIARPVRDRGVDLIAYDERHNEFIAKSIQVKASSIESFSVDKKYEKSVGLLIIYVWNLESKPIAYALTYKEILMVANEMKWSETSSWEKGVYSTTKPSQKLKKLLEPFEMKKEKWKSKLFGVEKERIS